MDHEKRNKIPIQGKGNSLMSRSIEITAEVIGCRTRRPIRATERLEAAIYLVVVSLVEFKLASTT